MNFAHARARHTAFQSGVQKDEISLCAGLWECSVILATVLFKTLPVKSQREAAGFEPFSVH